ncbi:serum paraoxonase/arylesterase [Mariannaea sp. PMI_226]|nr:serum paraoxonase/arylesterase [Mariannaea sp. PMI_226]
MAVLKSIGPTILVAFLASFYGPAIHRSIKVLGFLREPANTAVDDSNIVTIENTMHCEDLHYHQLSNQLFTACEDHETLRFSWFPPLAHLNASAVGTSQGSIHVINPQTLKSQKLKFENFSGPFVTHGIDVVTDPENPKAVYIYAINHLPNPEYLEQLQEKEAGIKSKIEVAKSRPQLEVFHYVHGSATIQYIRSIRHPLIQTPNDVLGLSTTTLLVTNDHYYKDGHLRILEDLYSGAKWSSIICIRIPDLYTQTEKAELNVTASLLNTKLHNNNGLGHGRFNDEILINSATSGILHIGKLSDNKTSPRIKFFGNVALEAVADNPSYFLDPYATNDNDASGFVVTGLSKGANLISTSRNPSGKDPSMTWFVRPGSGPASSWEKKLLFEDDSSRIRSSSTAVLVGINPKTEGGKKKAWLFITGFLSRNIIAVKVDL